MRREATEGNAVLKHLLFFAYGVASYLIFPWPRSCMPIAFVGGFAVPTQLDGAGTLSAAAIAVNCLLLTVFAAQHSVMARRWFKERWTRIVPQPIERSTYVLCASLALLLLFSQWRPIGIPVWSVENTSARVFVWTLFASGTLIVLTVTTFLINHFDLFGLRQVGWRSPASHPAIAFGRRCRTGSCGTRCTRLRARVLGHPAHDAGAPRLRPGDDRLHRARDSVRGAGPGAQ